LLEDAEALAEAAEVQMRSDDILTPFLGECLCVRGLEGPGDLCHTCGCHVGVSECNGICSECEDAEGELLNCFACNLSFHRDCMPSVRWGLTGTTPTHLVQLPLPLTLP
jgi:hypothetical protein